MDVITHQLVSETEIFGVVDVYFDIELLRDAAAYTNRY